MKKILFLLAMLPMMVFTACSSGGESQNENIVAGIAGVWENNNILVSFDGNGYYAGILDEKFLDCGSYTVDGESISCLNTYLNKRTLFKVEKLSNNEVHLTVKYNDFDGADNEKEITLKKSTKKPAMKEHTLINKKYRFMLNSYGSCFVQFDSYNTAKMQTDEIRPNVQAWNYFYIEPYIYVQKYKDDNRGLSLFYQECDKGKICIQKVEIGDNGDIKKIEILNI